MPVAQLSIGPNIWLYTEALLLSAHLVVQSSRSCLVAVLGMGQLCCLPPYCQLLYTVVLRAALLR